MSDLLDKKENSKSNSAKSTHSTGLTQQSENLKPANRASTNYLRDAAEHLLVWMQRLQNEEINAQNVNAACNVAKQLASIVRTNIDLKKAGL
jgi:hypothetical protein